MKILSNVEFGIYSSTQESREKIYSDQLPKGYYYKYSEDPILILKTSKIPLANNLEFGIHFFKDDDEDDDSYLTIKILHPEIENGDKLSFSEHQYNVLTTEKKNIFIIQTIEEVWEIEAGYWTFQIWDRNLLLFEKEFELYDTYIPEEKDEVFFYDF